MPPDDELRLKLIYSLEANVRLLKRFQIFSNSPFLNKDYVYKQMISNSLAYFEGCLTQLRPLPLPIWKDTSLFLRRPRLVECLYHVWLTRFLKAFQQIDAIRDLLEAKNEISKVYSWYLTLKVYIKPEEDAIAEIKKQKEIEALDRAKNMQIEQPSP